MNAARDAMTAAVRVDYDSRTDQIEIVARREASAAIRDKIATAIARGDAVVRDVTGWGLYNALVRVGVTAPYDPYAPEYGDWLVRLEPGAAQ